MPKKSKGFGYKPFRLFKGKNPAPKESEVKRIKLKDFQTATDKTVDFCTENDIPGAVAYVFIGERPSDINIGISGLFTSKESIEHPDVQTFIDLITYVTLKDYLNLVEVATEKNKLEEFPVGHIFAVFFSLRPELGFERDWQIFCYHVYRHFRNNVNDALKACELVDNPQDLEDLIVNIWNSISHEDGICGEGNGSHKSPVPHERKAHLRRIKRKEGGYKLVPVRAAKVNG